MDREEFPARLNGLALGNQYDVVDLGMRQQRWDDARPDARNMTFAGRPAEDDGTFRIDGDDPNVRIALLEAARHPGDRSPGADADEDIIERVEIGADLARRELVVRLHGVQISVLVRPVRVRNGGAQTLHHLQAGLQESARVVQVLDLHHPWADAPEEGLVRAGDLGGA